MFRCGRIGLRALPTVKVGDEASKRGFMIDWQHSYCGPAPSPETWVGQWNIDSMLITLLAIGAAMIVRQRDAGSRRSGLLAIVVLALAFVSPLCGLTTALFAARAIHHVLLVTVAAPLLAVAVPWRQAGRHVPRMLAIFAAVLWAWHWPALYDAALANVATYWIMQLGLIVSAWGFWNAVRHAMPAMAITGIIGGALQMGFLGALLTFATRPLYAAHAVSTVPFGLGPLADQQYAGLIMWVPGLVPYAVAVAWFAHRRWSTMIRSGFPA
jgi:putative membrane protein